MLSDSTPALFPDRDIDPRPHCRAAHSALLCEHSHGERSAVEQFIRTAFATKHGARVQSFLPHLLTLRGAGGRLCAVAGYRGASEAPLYLENYLDVPIEQAIANSTGESVERSTVVEVGNLASSRCRTACHLMALLPGHLLDHGYVWITFTATQVVRQMLTRFTAPVIDLGAAQPEKVLHLGDAWGSYYENEPRVMAGRLADGLRFTAGRRASRGTAP